jgi:hypothetical protein
MRRGLRMNPQCLTCGSLLPEGARSPYCLPHYLEHQKARNRAKVRAYRERARNGPPNPDQPHLPTEVDLGWLDWMDPELGGTIRRVVGMLNGGRTTDDPEVIELAGRALQRYDSIQAAIEDRARPQEGGDWQITNWRGFFDSVRRAFA